MYMYVFTQNTKIYKKLKFFWIEMKNKLDYNLI